MSRQYSTPYIVNQGVVYQLQPVANVFDENWLQNFIFTHHQAIPLNEIEPAFGPLIPVCRELATRAGPIDMLFINTLGLPTMVECKLWKNPDQWRVLQLRHSLYNARNGSPPNWRRVSESTC